MRFSQATKPSTMASGEWDLFFCYNRRENASVAHVRSLLLERYGIAGWMDQKSLPGSTDFENEILILIDTCANCAVVLGSDGWGEYQKSVELPAILKRKQADPNFNIFLVLLPGADERNLELVDASYRRKHWIDLRSDISNTDAIWSLAAGVRPNEQNPEDRAHVLRYHLNSMAERWDSGGRKEHSLLYRGQLLADSQRAIASGVDTLANATRDFLSESERRQRHDVRVRRLAKAAAVLIAALVVGTLGWLAWSRTDRFQIQTILAAADSDFSQLDSTIIQDITTTLFETNHVAEAERMIKRLPLPADQLSVIDGTLATLAQAGDSRHSEELVSAVLARIPAVEDKELRSRTLRAIVEYLLKFHNIDRAVSLSEQIESERDRATVSLLIARAMAEGGGRTTQHDSVPKRWFTPERIGTLGSIAALRKST